MKVTVVGGGPGGLYAAILLRRADPSTAVTVLERNAPEDTFGFGVVFSAATLAELEAADRPSYQRLWDACARWDPIEVRYLGERVRASGNRFAAISRHRLLRILQERAAEVGADLRFRTEVHDVDALLDADLVIAADGVRSAVRERFAAAFRPRLVQEGSTYIWLATDQRFDAFTFIFEATEVGTFQAHIYPFAEDRATFIVECGHDTWRKAGLDGTGPLPPGVTDEAAVAYCEEVFAAHLDGHRLIGNGSRWLDWTTVRNDRWQHRNVVLVGDAAHTAHFSIGSGTKLALEDAVALAAAVGDHGGDVAAALPDYESRRKPSVDGLQQAARESLDWFGRYRRYWGFEPPQLAYSLLTRSKRVDYDNTRRRDPVLVAVLDRWYAARATGADPRALQAAPPPALTPVSLGAVTLPNRLAAVAADPLATAADGMPADGHLDALRMAAASGAALVLVDDVAVAADGRRTPDDAGLYDDAHAERWAAALAAVPAGAVVAARLVHAGARAATRPRVHGVDLPLPADRAWPLVAASPLPYTPLSAVPAALDGEGMGAVRAAFVAAARRAAAAGFGAVELHAAHGHLLASFLSPLTNLRDDAYGGDVEGRLRFPLEVLAAVREVWPADRLLSVCFSASDLEPGGLAPDDAVEVARRLHAGGADLLHVVAGQTTRRSRPRYETGFNTPWSDLVRNEARVPVLVSGNLPRVDDVNHVLMAGLADLGVLGLPSVEAPAWLR